MSSSTIQLGMKPVAIWPEGQEPEISGDPTIRRITFTDIQEYHPRLIARILELEENQRLRGRQSRGAGGTRINSPGQWLGPEAELIAARATALFQKVLECERAAIDASWANVYRAGDYSMPQSHARSTATVVYCLDAGDEDLGDPHGGHLGFVDPRLPHCCREQEGCVTTPFYPGMATGSMLIFPSQLVHVVNPYLGKRPRITLSWNINKEIFAASAPAEAAMNTPEEELSSPRVS